MAAIEAKITGLDKLRDKFRRMPEEIKLATRKAMEEGAASVVAMARGLCPREQGDLADSIGWTWGDPPEGSMVIGQSAVGSGEGGTERITIYAGNDKAYYARWVEFGTVKAGAQPFFYPSWRSLRRKVKSRHTSAMTKALKKVAAGGN